MIGKKPDIKPFPKTETRLGEGTSLKGTLRFSKSLAIRGHFEGKIISEGFLFVDEGAEVKADLEVGSVIIGGTVRGNVTARGRLEMLPTGRVYGNIRAGKLRIADGVVFEGKCEMLRNADALEIFSAPVDQLKQSAQGV